jgi:hypothetical protein
MIFASSRWPFPKRKNSHSDRLDRCVGGNCPLLQVEVSTKCAWKPTSTPRGGRRRKIGDQVHSVDETEARNGQALKKVEKRRRSAPGQHCQGKFCIALPIPMCDVLVQPPQKKLAGMWTNGALLHIFLLGRLS